MCLSPYKISPINPISAKRVYVPCGKCKDCRNSHKISWSMRLSLELEVAQKNGWTVGFCTLTYNDENLPHFPDEAYCVDSVSDLPLDSPSCFDKKQVRTFVVNIRRDLDDIYNVHGLKYMICSEYGSYTQRPHYHCIFAWPEKIYDELGDVVGGCSAADFFALIKKYWSFGFVFPKDLNGGFDSHNHLHKPFVVQGSARFASAYAGKYCCKDLNFVKVLQGYKFNRKSPSFKNGDCFHIQNKSLGLSYLVGKSESEIYDLLFKGVSFSGDKKLHQLPLYLRNKIFFTPTYTVERNVYCGVRKVVDKVLLQASDAYLESIGMRVEYKRLVGRACTDFFHKYRNEIFERKVSYWSDVFHGLCDERTISGYDFSFWKDDSLNPKRLSSIMDDMRSGLNFDYIARFFVARYGVPWKYQYDIDDVDLWSLRYILPSVPDSFKSFKRISCTEFCFLRDLCDTYLGYLGLVCSSYSPVDILVEKLKDKFKHME